MRRRIVLPALVSTVAGLVLGIVLASPASAAITVTLPDQVTVKPGTVVIVKAQTPEGYTCESAWTTEITGKRSIVKSVSAVSCTGGVATWRVRVSQVKRGDAYIYFTATSAPMVMTNDDGSIYTMDPMTEVLDLTLSLKRPKPSSTNGGVCLTADGRLCSAVGAT